MPVTETNAYRLCDNFAIVAKETGDCKGVEHNKEEAEAIARYLTNYTGNTYIVVKNSIDDVKEARKLRDPNNLRVKFREDILREMGVWK